MILGRDEILQDVVDTAQEYWRRDHPTFLAHRDSWAESIFFRLGPEGCIGQLQKFHQERTGWSSDLERRYIRLPSLLLARSALLSLIIETLPPSRVLSLG